MEFSSVLRIAETAWIIQASRVVQTQTALNEAVYVIPRTQSGEVAIPYPPPLTFPLGSGMFECPPNCRNCLDYSSVKVAATARQQPMR